MKPLFTLLAAGLAVAAFAQPTPPAAPPPGPEHARFAVWHGDWTYEGRTLATPLGPEAKIHGTLASRPILHGFAVENTYVELGGGAAVTSLERCWYDPAARGYGYAFLGADGYVESGPFTMADGGGTWSADCFAGGKAFKMRGVEKVAPDRQAITRTADISVDGGRTWHAYLEMKLRKTAGLPTAAGDEQELIRLEHEWARAYVARDIRTLDRLEADDWAYTDAEGKVSTKADEHRDVSSGTYTATVFTMSDLKARVYGDAAVVTGRQVEQATMAGRDASAEFQLTDTWIRRDGRWQCVATHLSKVAPPADEAAIRAQGRQAVIDTFAAMDRQDYDSFRQLIPADALIRLSGTPEPLSREDLIGFLQGYWKSFPDTTHVIHEVVAEGDVVIAHVTCQGTHRGQFEGVAPTGKSVSYDGAHVVRIAQGRVREWRVLDDSLSLMQQLGLRLAPAAAPPPRSSVP